MKSVNLVPRKITSLKGKMQEIHLQPQSRKAACWLLPASSQSHVATASGGHRRHSCGALSKILRAGQHTTAYPVLVPHSCTGQDLDTEQKNLIQKQIPKPGISELISVAEINFFFFTFHHCMSLCDSVSSRFQTLKPPHCTSGS